MMLRTISGTGVIPARNFCSRTTRASSSSVAVGRGRMMKSVSLSSSSIIQTSVSIRPYRLFSSYMSADHLDATAASQRPPNLSKVLVANRGEIACRVLRTCRRLGIPTVAVYSVADGPNALHARMADEAFQIGHGPSPGESYLLQDEILRICDTTQAHAVHPGYGFLSENAGFANKVQQAGIEFVGPPTEAIMAMGSKSQSKAIMEQAGVPTTPGHYGDDNQDPEFLKTKAIEIGFPLLIKAVMGGGGKGMRLVWNENEFFDALASCQNESRSAFGDASVLLEKYLVKPRHVEVQVIADKHGNVVHLYERDCSLQRRHQKIIEEAPANDLDPEVRHRLGEMGKRAAQAVGYVNAGTVEFLLDTVDPTQFYFCEMNTRLQVEHPITELITGIDLVEWQLRVAAGERLPITDQVDIVANGHAFEARVYAENPARNFLPAAGTVWHHRPPTTINTGICPQSGVRVDTGLQSGQDIGVYYDPMISKLIVHGPNRQQALSKLIHALKRYQIAGVPTNIDFLINCAKHPVFGRAGEVNTGFLDDYADDVKVTEDNAIPSSMAQAVGSLAAMLLLENRIGIKMNTPPTHPWSSLSGSWRMGGELGRARRKLHLANIDDDVDAEGANASIECISNRDGSFEVHTIDGDVITVNGQLTADGKMEIIVNGSKRIRLTTVLKETNNVIHVRMWPEGMEGNDDYFWKLDILHPLMPTSSASVLVGKGQGLVKSPMPGKISRVNFAVGEAVKEGDVVVVMEAMKMEHSIKAPCDGILIESGYKAGDIVNDGAVLFLVDSGEDSDSDVSAIAQ